MRVDAIEAIRGCPMFSGLSAQDLEELVAGGHRRQVSNGACLIAAGDEADGLIVILNGEVEVHRQTDEGETPLAILGPGDFVGEMALIDDAPRSATVCAISDAEILEISRDQFDNLIDKSPEAGRALIRTVLTRLRSTEAMLVNQEKLAALGRLSAGLAHELNNPVAAVGRFATQLSSSIESWQSATVELTHLGPVLQIDELTDRATQLKRITASGKSAHLSAIQQAAREEELATWLRKRGVRNEWSIAATLASVGVTPADLQSFSEQVDQKGLPQAIEWLNATISIDMSLQQLRMSAQRVSEIVAAVKRYSHMDRAAAERTNVNQALETTLVILQHKMRGISLNLDLDPELPEIDGYPAELNQVWTNLIDNAIDALNSQGSVAIRTRQLEGNVVVEISDDGPGIAPEHQRRLFEPFFTTKAPGAGTGLGLHIAHNIVVQRHRGKIDVESRPGSTTFKVALPIAFSSQ